MGLIDKAKNWLFGRALKKAAVQVAIGAASFAAAKKGMTESYGINLEIDPDAMAVGLLGLFNIGRNWLKVKMPKVFGWL